MFWPITSIHGSSKIDQITKKEEGIYQTGKEVCKGEEDITEFVKGRGLNSFQVNHRKSRPDGPPQSDLLAYSEYGSQVYVVYVCPIRNQLNH